MESDIQKKTRFLRYKKKECRTLHETYHDCSICKTSIFYDDEYRDGGPGNRAHEWCVEHRLQEPPKIPKRRLVRKPNGSQDS